MKSILKKNSSSHKLLQREATIQRAIGKYIVEYSSENSDLLRVSIVKVALSKDGSHLTVLLHSSLGEDFIKNIITFLSKKTKLIRMTLAKDVILRRVPFIYFRYDDLMNKITRIENLISEVIQKDQEEKDKMHNDDCNNS